MEEEKQKMSVYFPLDLLERVRESAKEHRRSFNQEVLWLIERSLEQQKGENQRGSQGI